MDQKFDSKAKKTGKRKKKASADAKSELPQLHMHPPAPLGFFEQEETPVEKVLSDLGVTKGNGIPDSERQAGIIVRVSTPYQGQEGTSLETQEERCCAAANNDGYEVKPEHIWRCIESGANMNRRGLEMALEAVRERKIKKLYAYTYDRMTRDPVDMLNIMRICSENDVILEFVEGPSDTSDEGQLLMFILGYAAKRERLQFIERSKRGREEAAKQGRMPVGTGCGIYGCDWDYEHKCRVINEKEAAVVRMMFQMAADGVSKYHIACALNEANIPSKLGKKWTINAVERTLKNRAYTGHQYYGLRQQRRINGKYVQVGWRTEEEAIPIDNYTPQIISTELFEAVQERLVVPQSRRKKEGARHLLTGLIWCAKCGCRMVASMQARGLAYYRCRNAIHTVGREITCDALNVRADKLEPLVWKIVRDVIADPAVLSHEIRLNAETGDGDIGEEMKKLRKEISDCKNQESRLLDPYLEAAYDVDLLMAKAGPIKALREEKQRQLRILEEQQKSKDEAAEAERRIAEYCQRFEEGLENLDIEGKRATLAAFGVRVEATPEELSTTITVDPAATTMSPSSSWLGK